MTDPAEPTAADEHAILIAFLATHNAVCPLCGYDLHLLRSPRCPECGRELKLTVGMVQPYLAAWIALLVTLCATAGVGLLCVLLVLKEGWQEAIGGTKPGFAFIMLTYMCLTLSPILVIVARRRLLRLTRPMQWAIFVITLILCGSLLIAFISTVE